MRPPICVVCGRDMRSQPGLARSVAFRRMESDDEWYRRAESSPGFVGHPPNVEWFCGQHVEAAQTRAGMPIGDALAAIRASRRPAGRLRSRLRRLRGSTG